MKNENFRFVNPDESIGIEYTKLIDYFKDSSEVVIIPQNKKETLNRFALRISVGFAYAQFNEQEVTFLKDFYGLDYENISPAELFEWKTYDIDTLVKEIEKNNMVFAKLVEAVIRIGEVFAYRYEGEDTTHILIHLF